MRRHIVSVIFALAVLPAASSAQVRILAGGGLSNPIGSFGDAVDPGWHLGGGLQLGFPSIPIGIRADGAYHSFGEASSTPKSSILSGALSLVVTLPGVGLEPYFLGGVDTYRSSVKGLGSTNNGGFHGAFGVNIGAMGFGGFAEVRLDNMKASGAHSRFVSATVGFRL